SLLFLGLVAAVCLGLNLLFLTVYLICLCCCKRDAEPESKRPGSCCVTWTAVVAGLVCCAAVGAGFYGNSETNDGVYQLLYALGNANRTLTGIDALVGTAAPARPGCTRGAGVSPQKGAFVPGRAAARLGAAGFGLGPGDQVTVPWLAYLLFFILVLTVCLLGCLGLAKRSRCLLTAMLCCGLLTLLLSWASVAVDAAAAVGTSDFCVAPDKFVMNLTESDISAEVVHYYLYCDQSRSSPFQQALTVFQRSLTTMQVQVQGLVQFALPLFPMAEKDLLEVQQLLNASETSLHQLTALLDCRGLHKDYLDALIGICYDGVEGLLYLLLFSLLVAASFSTIICAAPRAWKHLAARDRDYDDMDEEDPFNPQARRMA
ncbi:TTYH2 protein, partial [Casuarius casuarius]|nr:TTYH2 protein [Casuarius casuarius]